jgi:hypothetical protein
VYIVCKLPPRDVRRAASIPEKMAVFLLLRTFNVSVETIENEEVVVKANMEHSIKLNAIDG